MNAAAIIPARYDSTRFPGKLLADRTGQPLIRHVWEQARQAQRVARLLIATDDSRIAAAAREFGAEVVLTAASHANGTSRIEEAVRLAGVRQEIIINVQGDEPTIDPALIDAVAETLMADTGAQVATIASPLDSPEDEADPNVVKVVCALNGRALYFSRSSIPFRRSLPALQRLRHVGLYAYRREFLPVYVGLTPTSLEQAESLEQLRILEHGHAIAVAVRNSTHCGIDTPEQYERFVASYGTAG